MQIIGINHKTAPIDIREKFYLNPTQQDLFLSELKSNPQVLECFLLSTCNRTEVYLELLNSSPYSCFVIDLITRIKKLPLDFAPGKYFYRYADMDAVDHLLRVSTGLDSLVLGEKQILGQVKAASERARQCGMLSAQFNILTNIAIKAGKKAQTETDVSCGGSSISWAAIARACKELNGLEGKSALVIGTGKMGEMALEQLNNRNIEKLYLMNRTETKAAELAQKFKGQALAFCDIKEALVEVNFCICSTDAPHYILEKSTIDKVMTLRQQKPLLLIDISMPRNIHPDAAHTPGVTLIGIDGLEQIVGENMRRRQAAVAQVNAIIGKKKEEFARKIEKLRKLGNSEQILTTG